MIVQATSAGYVCDKYWARLESIGDNYKDKNTWIILSDLQTNCPNNSFYS